uniref:PHD-type domain-containing protein n=1 Tax=Homalodisca liturata TaxID=320908 RepID=A0A1B6I4X7_9HEMI
MPKTNSETSKYPCGVCSIGVRYSGIICTGSCSQWYHGGCVNISDKHLKKLTQDEIKTWTCENCKTSMTAQNGSMSELTFVAIGEAEQHPTSKTPSPSGYHKVKENRNTVISDLELSLSAVKTKVKDQEGQEEDDLETSLALAAEVGSLLLAENLELKKDAEDLSTRNSALEAKLAELEATLEDRTEAEEKYLQKIEESGRKLQEAIAQIAKEKQNRQELQNFYEDHDTRQTLIFDEQANKILELEQIILNLKREKSGQRDLDKTGLPQTPKLTSASETQTDYSEFYVPNYSASLLIELTQLKIRQDQLECSVVTLQEKLLKQGEQTNPATPPALTQSTPTAKSLPCSKNHNISKSKKQTGKERNHFSVSLQVAKNKARHEEPANVETGLRRTTVNEGLIEGIRREKKPPLSAKILPSGETLEEFVTRELEALKGCSENDHFQTQQRQNKPISKNFSNQSQPPQIYINMEVASKNENAFLENCQPKQERHKNIQNHRIFINSTLKKRTQPQKSQFSTRI